MTKLAGIKIGFIGAGNMADALIRGLLKSGQVEAKHLFASDVSEERLTHMAKSYGITVNRENLQIVSAADLVVIAVKPKTVKPVLEELKGKVSAKHLMVSIAAGVPTQFFTSVLGPELKLARAMPNTPARVLKGTTGVFFLDTVDEKERKVVQDFFGSVGTTTVLEDESMLNAVTGLSGSGPAFGYLVIEAMADAGVLVGLPRASALRLAASAILGAAHMVLETGIDPAILRGMVSSPGGTTIMGLKELEEAGVRGALMKAVEAAKKRADALVLAPEEPKDK